MEVTIPHEPQTVRVVRQQPQLVQQVVTPTNVTSTITTVQTPATKTVEITKAKRVRIELSTVQDMLSQVRFSHIEVLYLKTGWYMQVKADFALKDAENKKIEREIQELNDELHEVIRQTDEQAIMSGAAGAASDEEGRKLEGYKLKAISLESSLERVKQNSLADLLSARSEGTKLHKLTKDLT